ncbi:MAG: hypothetical protein K2X27_11520 [Candidatus Obscuribacterales bacterium]|nr:hypothetical protein [Candidatus Obscuribacterales bacterium]
MQKTELLPYLKTALRFYNSDQLNFDSDLLKLFGLEENPFDPALLRRYFSKWAPRPHLQAEYLPKFETSKNVNLLLHANLTRIDLNSTLDQVQKIEFVNNEGKKFSLEMKKLVLCMGGIENARILLANTRQIPQGIGNQHDLLGRFFQDHTQLMAGFLKPEDEKKLQEHCFERTHNGLLYTPKFSLNFEKQRQEKLLNLSATIWPGNPDTILPRRVLSNIRRLRFTTSQLISGPAFDLVQLALKNQALQIEKCLHPSQQRISVSIMAQQEPSPESRILLAKKRDRLGIPQSKIQWRPTVNSWRSMVRFAEILQSQLEKSALGKLELLPHIRQNSKHWQIFMFDSCHPIGSTRMAKSPQEGVLDTDCRVFGISNLFVLGSSSFPTGGHSNPTLTLSALAFRFFDQIIKPELEAQEKMP